MEIVVPIIIGFIICVQIFFFVKNFLRMQQFRDIFSIPGSWHITRDTETNLVNGIDGKGNNIFQSIINSINKYLGYNTGSVIDFGLLKDAVDRHCDSVENDISTQTPIPLYWGLAGTMLGVIIGLWDLLGSGAIRDLMGSNSEATINMTASGAVTGVSALLSGVAWAMVASICGIVLTTTNSLLFKRCKLYEENGKNSFLAWMQSELLPELPSDTSEALNNLVKNLNRFNNTFANNTSSLRDALKEVNQSYAIQADIIKAVHDMDIMKMAKANVKVLTQLQESTEKLEQFNHYLDSIKGYTEAIHRFETLFDQQAERLNILEEIRDFFRRHKSEIAKTAADADSALRTSLNRIKESTSSNVQELHNRFIDQSETFKSILKEEKESFEKLSAQISAQFNTQLDKMPRIYRQLEEISLIPDKLDKLIEKIERSNSNLITNISSSLKSSDKSSNGGISIMEGGIDKTPQWMKITGLIGIIIIAVACIFNVVTYFFSHEEKIATEEELYNTKIGDYNDPVENAVDSSVSITSKVPNKEESIDTQDTLKLKTPVDNL